MSPRRASGTDIRSRREAAGMTQLELAAAAGVSVAGLSLIELGKTRPQRSTLAAIEAALGEHAVPEWEPCDEPHGDDGEPIGGWHVPPECAGQTVERAYSMEGGILHRRVTDRSDRSVVYARRELLDSDPEPWNREPR